MLSSALIGCFTVPLISKTETQGGKYIFKYFLSQLYRRVIILYIKHGHREAVINTRGIGTAFEWSVDHEQGRVYGMMGVVIPTVVSQSMLCSDSPVFFFKSRDLHKEETMVSEAHCMSFPYAELLILNYAMA